MRRLFIILALLLLGMAPADQGAILVGLEEGATVPAGAEHLFGTVYLIQNARSALSAYEEMPGVRWVERDIEVELLDKPDDGWFVQQWALHNDRDTDIDWLQAWNVAPTSKGPVIAIIDSGLYFEHQDRPALWENKAEIPNNIDDDENGIVDDYHGANVVELLKIPDGYGFRGDDEALHDWHGHGTHVSGIAAAPTNNEKGVAGVSDARIMVVKVFAGDSTKTKASTVARAIVYATDSGAKIISMSLGADTYSQVMHEACQYAYARGVLLVAATGNGGEELVYYPAAYPEVIAVGAVNIAGQKAPWSSYGPELEVMAPGEGIISSAPPWAPCWMGNPDNPDNQYCKMSGTSMSTPHIAGLAAYLLARDPGLTHTEVRQIINETADDLGDPNLYGHGRINVKRAISRITSRNLLKNHSFERGKRPWKGTGKRVKTCCHKKWAWRLKAGERLRQVVELKGKRGDILWFGIQANTKFSRNATRLTITLIYVDGTRESRRTPLSSDFCNWDRTELSITAKKRYKKVIVSIGQRMAKTAAKFDNASLRRTE